MPNNNRNSIICNWSVEQVIKWLERKGYEESIRHSFENHHICGRSLLLLNEDDLRYMGIVKIGFMKELLLDIQQLKIDSRQSLFDGGYDPNSLLHLPKACARLNGFVDSVDLKARPNVLHLKSDTCDAMNSVDYYPYRDSYQSSQSSEDGRSSNLRPEITKALIALAYLFVVTWITSFVMVIVHDRVPDMKRYPPLPDIFLDNVPYIPWAFHMCEWTASLLTLIWITVLIFHKHRFILLRRFFALSGTVYLLRCITMLITSLSVPGAHLKCSPRSSKYEPEYLFGELISKASQAYIIWKNAGLSIRGVRTCGDYMFSGHSVVLTMFNFFITEYTPRDLHLLHVFSWVLNVFGIFFILSGHEHYSIDVFIAFYITSRLFLYYHTLANNQALMQRDSNRTRIWFPLFSFFEASMDGIVPNEYETPAEILDGIRCLLTYCANEMVGFALKSWLMKIRLLFKKTYSSTKSSSSSSSSSRHLFVGSTIGGRRQKLKSH